MPNLDSFLDINDTMLWKGAAIHQIDVFKALAGRLGLQPKVVSSHTSKSIKLPVVKFEAGGVSFYIRDNFYDFNLCAVGNAPFNLTLAQFMSGVQAPLTWEWYLEQIARCRGYTWQYFTDEEMDDPRILRVFKVHKFYVDKPDAKPMEWKVEADRKDRWIKRMTDPEWYWKDWSSGALCWDGAFGPGVQMYAQEHPFMQGIEEVVPAGAEKPYKQGCTMFALALGKIEQVEALIRKLSGGSQS